MKYELVIFDCDGVLIDSEGMAHQAIVDVLAEYGITMSVEEALERYVGRTAAYEKADIEARYGKALPQDFFQKRRARMIQLFERGLEPISGVRELIEALPCKRCVASGSSLMRLRQTLESTGLWDLFEPNVFSAEEVPFGKPAPDIFLHAAQKMRVEPSRCLVIEDSPAGVRGGVAAGAHVYGFTGASHCLKGHAEALKAEGAEKVFSTMKALSDDVLKDAHD